MINLPKLAWHAYVKLAKRTHSLAIPVPNKLAAVGRVWVHPTYLRHVWHQDEDEIFKTLNLLLSSDSTYLDIGANIGLTTLAAAKRVGSNGHVVAFEPSHENLRMLRYHLRWNNTNNVHVEASCVGDSDGFIDFCLQQDGLHGSNSLTFSHKDNAPFVGNNYHKINVPIVRLDSWCSRTGIIPDVIKIDVEGAELDALNGARELILQNRPTLLVGVHPFWWPDRQRTNALAQFFKDVDYIVTTLDGNPADPVEFKDYLCLPTPRDNLKNKLDSTHSSLVS